MATITLTIPDAQAPRLIADLATYRGVDISSMTLAQKVAFLKADIRSYWTDIMAQVELSAVMQAASDNARTTRLADIAANVTVT